MTCMRRSAAAIAACLAVLFVASPAGQEPATQVKGSSPLRISVELVQIDATVTDANGRPIRDLTAADFEVFQDNRPQKISAFQYVAADGIGTSLTAAPPAANAPHLPSAPSPADVRRTIAVVVDDLSLSFESIGRVRTALRRFIDDQMQPGDLVAILRTGAGMGALQQFTTDKRMLRAAADRVQWNRVVSVTPFAATDVDGRINAIEKEFRTAGTLDAVLYVLRGVSQLPGRKSLLLLSDGFRLTDADNSYGRVSGMVRAVADAANRAAVVVYGIDLRGLAAPGANAAAGGPQEPGAAVARETAERRTNEAGPQRLAEDTGGLFIRNVNDIASGLQRVLDDTQGFYLLGYVPDASTFSDTADKFHQLRVRVKRPGLRVRTRSGFLGRTEPVDTATTDPMLNAVTSPFAGGDIRLRLSSFFGQSRDLGSVIQSVMHVDPGNLTFTEAADGTRGAQLEVLAVTFGDGGLVADQLRRSYTVRLTPDRLETALRQGFVYNMRLPVKRPGPYQLRVALRDVATGRIGSASQFIDVPDLKSRQLALSGLFIQGLGAGGMADGSVEVEDPNATVAVRRFRRGTQAGYFCYAYNAAPEPSGKTQIAWEMRLFRGSVEIMRQGPHPVTASSEPGEAAIVGRLLIPPSMLSGTYVLEIAVEHRVGKRTRRATQATDFEVID